MVVDFGLGSWVLILVWVCGCWRLYVFFLLLLFYDFNNDKIVIMYCFLGSGDG